MTADRKGLIEKAEDSLRAAKLLEENGLIDFAASRAYYAMFYVSQAFLLGKGLTFSKHGSLIAAFGQHFVKTGLIPAHFHQNLIKAYNKRISGDYTINSNLTNTEVATMISQAEEFIALAEQMLSAKSPESGRGLADLASDDTFALREEIPWPLP